MEVPKESPDKPIEEPQKTPPTFRTTSPRPNRAKAKYSNAIMEASGLVFQGTQGKPMTTTNLKAYINKMHREVTLDRTEQHSWERH